MKQLEEKVTGMKFYYKVHKDTNIETMPLRPLHSCIGAPTQYLSQVLTDILQPFLTQKYIPTYIQDSNQLLYRLKELGSLDSGSTLISSDVSALYPSIPHREGLETIQSFLEENSSFVVGQIQYIIEALKLVITQNFVMWNGNIYAQDSGVAMGTPVAVAYANIFMHWIDTQLRQRADYIIEHIRYIDDNLFIIPEDRIEETMTIANSLLVPHIKFTYEKLDKYSDIGLPFLDTKLFISEDLTIESRLYTKKTDKHTYLLPTSYHPSHITKNIPLAVFNRIRRICSSLEWFQADALKAIAWLEDRGYRFTEIQKAVEKSSNKDRWEMINRIEDNRCNKLDVVAKHNTVIDIPLIITYSHNARLVKQVLINRQPLLNASFNKTKVKPRLAYRRQKNINDILIQRGLRGPITGSAVVEHVLTRCGSKPKYRVPCPCKGQHDQHICRCCVHLKLKLEGVEIRLHKVVNCDSKNVIYVIGCRICNKLYIGETQQQLKERFLQHLNNIQKFSQPLYTHFNKVHKAENIFISVVEIVRSNDHAFRKIREAWWINKLQTLEPRGFNIKLECNQIYQQSSTTINLERDKKKRWV